MTVTFRALVAGVAAVGFLAASQATYAQDKTIKIGALFPMSGPGSYFGAQDKQGVELALEQLNKDGVNGYKFVVQYEDSSCAPLPATQAAKRLIEQFKPDVIIGEECSDATLP
jgi:branched-chain amino acid transport system substrate-binding protein